MAAVPNPFRPGFALRPLVLAGRDEVLAAGEEAILTAAEDGRTPMPIFVVGPRGVGKTVVLEEISVRAGVEYGWPRLFVEGSPSSSLMGSIAREATIIERVVSETGKKSRLKLSEAVLQAKVAGVGAELHLSRADDAPQLDGLDKLLHALAERSSGLVLVVDEAHSARPEDFARLASTIQSAVRVEAPLISAIGGLPSLRRRPAETEESLGYLERADWFELGLLSEADTRLAFEQTASQAGRPMVKQASAILSSASGGYPFAIQVFGKHAWRASQDQATITARHAKAGLQPAEIELSRNLYAGRWEQTPPGARKYLLAVAKLIAEKRPATSRAVADLLGRTTQQTSPVRARLLERGTLMVQGDELRFMVPGFGEWIRAHSDPQMMQRRVVRRINERDVSR